MNVLELHERMRFAKTMRNNIIVYTNSCTLTHASNRMGSDEHLRGNSQQSVTKPQAYVIQHIINKVQ